MRLPAPLLRRNKNSHKNDFGHVLVVAGSPTMLGAAALTGLAAMRAGAGLTTIAVARSLNLTLQKKISNVIMTCPLPETRQGTVTLKAFELLSQRWSKYTAIAIGPGMTTMPSTTAFIDKMYRMCPLPMVVDADALNALVGTIACISKHLAPRVLTPHAGEMARLTGIPTPTDPGGRKAIAKEYAKRWGVVLVLKGHKTVVASPDGEIYVNTTGNPGMASAGSGDVLTGILTAFLAQGATAIEAAKCAVYLHGKIGDIIAQASTEGSLIAEDIIDALPKALRNPSLGASIRKNL